MTQPDPNPKPSHPSEKSLPIETEYATTPTSESHSTSTNKFESKYGSSPAALMFGEEGEMDKEEERRAVRMTISSPFLSSMSNLRGIVAFNAQSPCFLSRGEHTC